MRGGTALRFFTFFPLFAKGFFYQAHNILQLFLIYYHIGRLPSKSFEFDR